LTVPAQMFVDLLELGDRSGINLRLREPAAVQSMAAIIDPVALQGG
jgi:hypothetical protein